MVEDEYLILDFVCDEITDSGIPAAGATTAAEAMRILETDSSISALVTDIDMPGAMNGLMLADEVCDRWPQIKIVITSGRRRPANYEMPRGAVFVPKPFMPRQIVDSIERMH